MPACGEYLEKSEKNTPKTAKAKGGKRNQMFRQVKGSVRNAQKKS